MDNRRTGNADWTTKRSNNNFPPNELRHGFKPDQNRNGRKDWCIGFRALEEIANSDANYTILRIFESKKSFINRLNSDKTEDMFVLIVKILSKFSASRFIELKMVLLKDISETNFAVSLRNYLNNLSQAPINQSRNKYYWNNPQEFWCNFVLFCGYIVEYTPQIALRYKDLIDIASSGEWQTKLKQTTTNSNVWAPNSELKPQACKGCFKLNIPFEIRGREDPPDDFRSLSVVPTPQELLNQQVFVLPNIIQGRYRNIEHYLDVQFRLLREDCFGPLREGIIEYQKYPGKEKYENISVHRNVKFVEPFKHRDKIGELIQLDAKSIKELKHTNWESSKRLIYGSLVLFTKNNCKSFITATVMDRDLKLIRNGLIPISFVGNYAGDISYMDDSFTMIESEVYFEPYYHVLKALQQPDFPANLAMEQYIVSVDPTPKPPSYLNTGTVFSVQIKSDAPFSSSSKTFRVLDPATWPTRERLELNRSQYKAYHLALTHEFAVIQGPPGTGKTHLGVKIARALLENLPSEKMLVICYTNHALDQFLEAILPVTNSIVRIGGQSRSEKLKEFNLTEIKSKSKFNLKPEARQTFFDQKLSLENAVCELQTAQKEFHYLTSSVISYSSLLEYAPEAKHLGLFYANNRRHVRPEHILSDWLFEGMQYIDVDFDAIVRDNAKETYDEINLSKGEYDDDDDLLEKEIKIEMKPVSASFSVIETEKRIKSQLQRIGKERNKNTLQEIKREIVKLKSQMNLHNEMSKKRAVLLSLQIRNKTDFGTMHACERWAMYFKWVDTIHCQLSSKIQQLQNSVEKARTVQQESQMLVNANILKDYKVIGMTTSGAARQRTMLQALALSIVIVEEAAEVLEQHIITSLTKNCKHLILLGDHQQLRPSAAHVKLAREFNLEVSLFERMITNGIHSRRLNVQHRMRPEISALISPHIYEDLQNHPSVEKFPNVKGMANNLYFFSHKYRENQVDDSSSKMNQKEADIALKLANYLLQQGYTPDDVTILAAYSSQLVYMNKKREKFPNLSNMKITSIDNYQGEESKIILLSLVRNNNQNSIGFLGTENRVCVALSRAREGFYILGNMDMLRKNSALWAKIAQTLENNGSLVSALVLKCQNHPQQLTMISSPADFEKVPDGGCLLACGRGRACGHACPLPCHRAPCPQCQQQCDRVVCKRNHKCPLKCWMQCQPCQQKMVKMMPCGHKKEMLCHVKASTVRCDAPVTVTLLCDHKKEMLCHVKASTVRCDAPVTVTLLCGHKKEMLCHDVKPSRVCCDAPVTVTLPCGHKKKTLCHIEASTVHCAVTVTVPLPCGHKVTKPCYQSISLVRCFEPCQRRKRGCTTRCNGIENHTCRRLCHEMCEDCDAPVKLCPCCVIL